MKKILTTIISFLFLGHMLAQNNKIEAVFGTSLGYEWNVFNAPTSSVNSGVFNSPFEQFTAGIGLLSKIGNHRFAWKTDFDGTVFFNASKANEYSAKTQLRHRYKINKKLWLNNECSFRRRGRATDDNNDDTFTIPGSYTYFMIENGITSYPVKSLKIPASWSYEHRWYDAENNEQSQYHEWIINTDFRYKFSKKHQLLGYNSYEYRKLIENNLESLAKEQTSWNRLENKLAYRYSFNTSWYIEPSFKSRYRTSSNYQRYNYIGFLPAFKVYYRLKGKTTLRSQISYEHRRYQNILVNDKKLTYKYVRLSVDWKQNLYKKLFLVTDLNWIWRNTNTPETQNSARSFKNGLISIGINVEL